MANRIAVNAPNLASAVNAVASALHVALHEELRFCADPLVYRHFLARVRVEEVQDEVAILTVPTPFLVMWVSSNYRELIADALERVPPMLRTHVLRLRDTSRSQVVLLPPAPPLEEQPQPAPEPCCIPLPLPPPLVRSPLLTTSVRKVAAIQDLVAERYGVDRAFLLSSSRLAKAVRPRQVAMYLAKLLTERSLPEIGRRFGGRDHTTVLHAVRKIGRLVEHPGELADVVDELRGRAEALFTPAPPLDGSREEDAADALASSVEELIHAS